MKRAQVLDIRRRVQYRSRGNCPVIKQIKISNLNGFDDIVLQPQKGFLAICGGTGVGKSALLETLHLALCPLVEGKVPAKSMRLGSPDVDVLVEHPSGEYQRRVPSGEIAAGALEGYVPEVRLVTLGERTAGLIDYFGATSEDLIIEGVEPSLLDKRSLGLLSRAIGKSFSEVRVYEIEDQEREDSLRPYFIVRENELEYGLRSMGTGELSAIYMTWLLSFLKPNAIVLLEEPEAMLPPMSHIGVFDLICNGALDKNLGVILSTHSAEIVAQLPHDQLIPLRRSRGQTLCSHSVSSKDDILSSLGLSLPKIGVACVEDDLSATVTSELIARYDLNLRKRVEISNLKTGFGAIKNALKYMPPILSFAVVGVLDGDVRDIVEKWDTASLCCFLPFEKCMEKEFIESIEEDPGKFASTSHRNLAAVEQALNRSVGHEPHDAFHDILKELGLPIQQGGEYSFHHWLDVSGESERCVRFVKDLRELFGL